MTDTPGSSFKPAAPAARSTAAKAASTSSEAPTGRATESQPPAESPTTAATESPTKPRSTVQPSPRNSIKISVRSTRRAFAIGDRTLGIQYIQRALDRQGYDVGAIDAHAGARTRRAFARFMDDAGLDPAVGPNRRALDLLGFDVVGDDEV